MKTTKIKYLIYGLPVFMLMFGSTACSERDVTDLEKASQYKTTPEVFIDGFSGGEDLNAWGKVTNFNIDAKEVYDGNYSIRIDVPNASDASGSWAGGNIFTASPRDLSGYDCLTFYAKSTVATTLTAGFGTDSKYNVSASLALTNTWTKYIIPIPVASRLTAMKSMFYYSAAPVNNAGYCIYFDDIKYEKLGTLAHPTIQNSLSSAVFLGKSVISSVALSVNLPTGANQVVTSGPAYYDFSSTNTSVATVSSDTISVIAAGTASIVASGFEGALVVNSNGIGAAPDPAYSSSEVLSVFSDSYSSATIYDFWCGNTKVSKVAVGANYMYYFTSLDWTCMVNFNATTSTGYLNAGSYKYMHIDVMSPVAVTTSSKLTVNLGDYTTGSNVSKAIYNYTCTSADKLKWVQLDIPVSSFTRNKVGYVTFVGTNLTNLYVDNVYFHN